MAEIIQSLWIGESLGPLQEISIASFLHHGHEYHLHCYQKIGNVPSGVVVEDASETLPASAIFCYPSGAERGSVAAFANLFRYKLLLERGGWWVDTDVVCLRPFDFAGPTVLAGEAAQDSYTVTNALMRLPAGHPVARLCYEAAEQEDPRKLTWGMTGPLLLTRVVQQTRHQDAVKPPAVFCPIPYWQWESLLDADPTACHSLITRDTYAVHLWHELWRRKGIHRQPCVPSTSYLAQLWRTFQSSGMAGPLPPPAIERQLAELRRRRTGKIWRLLAGPVARVRRSRQRRWRARMRKFEALGLRRDELPVDYLEVHVTHCCNLACESCAHYSNQGHGGIVGLEEADRWMKLWNQRVSPHRFGLVGGEPAMHPRLSEFVRLSRKNWPHAELHLISNGLLLHRHPDLPAVLRDTDTCLKISIHHRSPQYRQRLQPVLELAEAWVAHQGIRLEYIFSYLNWTRRYQGFGSAMAPFDDKQPRLSWENCPAKGCAQLFEGKLWKCAPLAYLPLQAGKYNLSDKWKPYLAYRPLPPDCTPDELKAFFARQEEPYCGMCASTTLPLALPLPLAASASGEARRWAA